MALKPMKGWLSGSYLVAAVNAACQRALNLFSEVLEVDGEPQAGYLRGCPGLATALTTLPTYPLRALFAGGTPLNPLDGSGGRMFAVAGSKLYEIYINGGSGYVLTNGTTTVTWSSGGTFAPNAIWAGAAITINGNPYTISSVTNFQTLVLTGIPVAPATPVAYSVATPLVYASLRGDVGDDATHSPVTLIPNGNQLGIVSAGTFYCDNGAGPVAPMYQGVLYTDIVVGWAGTCITSGIYVIRSSGTPFNLGMVGKSMTIDGTPGYVVGNVTDGDRLQLTTSAGAHPVAVVFTAGVDTLVNSALLPFISADVGTTLVFVASGAFSAVTVTVSTVDAYGNALLSASPAVVGSTGGSATQAGGSVLAASLAFLDSFFVIAKPNSKQLNVSAPNDGTNWDKLDIAFKESYPDNIGEILGDHEELYVWGENRSEVWRAPGADPNFPFQRDPGACMPTGIAAPASACSVLQGVAWIAGDTRGQPYAVYAQGFVPNRISTHAVEQVWASYTYVADAVAFSYELDGHVFWQITFPTGDATWVYDFTASAQMGKPMWHERNSWDGAAFHRHRASCHCYVFGKHWVGDFATTAPGGGVADLRGNIYEMDSDLYTDTGRVITCVRTLPHLCEQRLREFFSKLQIDLETGGATRVTFTATLSGVGTTTLTDSAAGFLTTMVGGWVNIAGQGAYRITAYLTTSTVTVDRALGTFSAGSGTTGGLTVLVEWSDDGGTTFVGGAPGFVFTSNTNKLDRADFWQMGSADQGDRVYRITVTGNCRKSLIAAYLDSLTGIS